jgi:hypothetical protein
LQFHNHEMQIHRFMIMNCRATVVRGEISPSLQA